MVVNEISAADITDQAGTFTFDRLPAGTYSITFILGENADTESGIAVSPGATAVVEKEVDWEIGFVETLTVTSASLQRERIVGSACRDRGRRRAGDQSQGWVRSDPETARVHA